jgi:mono/diheme cytochrome c family protein
MIQQKRSGLIVTRGVSGVFLLMAIAVVILGQPSASAQNQKPSAKAAAAAVGNVENGKKIFAGQNCGSCHGADAQGGVGPLIGPPPGTMAQFVTSVRQPTGQMPAYSDKQVSDQELTDLYTYLKTMGTPAQAAVTLTGNAEHGKQIFSSYGCYQCHGYVGQGGAAGVRIGPPPISLKAVMAYIRQPTGNMPPYTSKVVSDQEVADIYSYLQSVPVPPPAKDIPLLNQ